LVFLDVLILVVVLYGGYNGYRTGFTMALVTVLAFVLAVIGGFKLLHEGMALIDEHFEVGGVLLPYLSFLLIFLIIIIVVNLVGKAFKSLLEMTLLGSIDKAAGGLLGVLKWAFGISVLFWISANFNFSLPDDWTEGSYLFPVLIDFAPSVIKGFGKVFPFLEGLLDMIKQLPENFEKPVQT